MSTYLCVHIGLNDETLLAQLSILPVDSFAENEDGTLDAYFPTESFNEEVEAELSDICSSFGTTYEIKELEDKNWNEEWESNFQPVEVEDFVRIRADFHEKSELFQYELVIQPKMAFGTGHHQTTYMMMKAMRQLDFAGKSVLDYGCGTGVLSLLAEKLGANDIVAVDIEEPSYQNTIENSEVNGCTKIQAMLGDLTVVPKNAYQLVLANINRNVLLATADSIKSMCDPSADLLLSGILDQDEEVISQTFTDLGFKLQRKFGKEGWLCLHFGLS